LTHSMGASEKYFRSDKPAKRVATGGSRSQRFPRHRC
jgi:hypothetical protein